MKATRRVSSVIFKSGFSPCSRVLRRARSLFLKAQSTDQHHWHHSGACWKCKILVPTPQLLNQNLLLNRISKRFICTLRLRSTDMRECRFTLHLLVLVMICQERQGADILSVMFQAPSSMYSIPFFTYNLNRSPNDLPPMALTAPKSHPTSQVLSHLNIRVLFKINYKLPFSFKILCIIAKFPLHRKNTRETSLCEIQSVPKTILWRILQLRARAHTPTPTPPLGSALK